MAGLIEHFRDTDTGRHLGKLALLDDPVSYGADRQREFRDAIRKLRSKIKEQRFNQLQRKASAASLTEDEKREYAALVRSGGAPEEEEK